jgi:uncharacterized membrane protein
MDEKEQIASLEAELEQLATQIKLQYSDLQRIRQQLQTLKGFSGVEGETGHQLIKQPSPLSFSSLENLIGLRLIHLIGIVVLVIGLSLGVKYAIDKNFVSEGLRIVLAYAAGLTLYFLSAWLRKQYMAFSAILFSGAMASLYFTTFGACVYYGFISYPVSFAIMIALTAFTTYQALVYNRQEIALLGLVGAYGIPFLISPNHGHPEMLFLYITIINCGVVFLCAKKHWALVGRSAQVITWALFIGWVALQNDVALKTYGLLFMALFFVLFSVNSLSGKLFRKKPLTLTATYQHLANNTAFFIAAQCVFNYAFADSTLARISLLFSLFIAAQAVAFYFWKEKTTSRLLAYCGLALFVLFIGFQWNGITVTLLWLLTAVVVFTVGVLTKSIPARMAAITLMGSTLLKLVLLDSLTFSTLQKVVAYLVLGVLLLVVSFFYQKFKQQLFGD